MSTIVVGLSAHDRRDLLRHGFDLSGYHEYMQHRGPRQPKVRIRGTISRDVLQVPYAPQGGTHDGLAGMWTRQPRPGRRDLSIWTNEATDTLALDLTFMEADFHHHVEPGLRALRKFAGGDEAVLLHNVSPSWAGPWFITTATEEVQDLQPGTNKISKAVVHCTFTRATRLDGIGASTGGTKSAKHPWAGYRWYTVKKGERLVGIATRECGDADLVGIIMTANHMRNMKIHAGQKIRIPKMGG